MSAHSALAVNEVNVDSTKSASESVALTTNSSESPQTNQPVLTIQPALDGTTSEGIDLINAPIESEGLPISIDHPIDNTIDSAIDVSLPPPTNVQVSRVNAGYVALKWVPAKGDELHSHPYGDAVSAYRVYRNRVAIADTLLPQYEDRTAPEGSVNYSVRSIRYRTEPQFDLIQSESAFLQAVIPSIELAIKQLNALEVPAQVVEDARIATAECGASHLMSDGAVVCYDANGQVWQPDTLGGDGQWLDGFTSANSSYVVSLRNPIGQHGPVPELPQVDIINMESGLKENVQLSLAGFIEKFNERPLGNGIAISGDNRLFVSGSLYQSHITRSLGPSPAIPPVTTAYFLAELSLLTGELIAFRRFEFVQALGGLAGVSQGRLVMFHSGQFSLVNTDSFYAEQTQTVIGVPIFRSAEFLYSKIEASSGVERNFRQQTTFGAD
ncbi:MAG: hypothetical protein KTR35_24880 [Gammaproteobacteria bacterium]|nr:hypothetical protein [Gammaproteobacteria bacterium]